MCVRIKEPAKGWFEMEQIGMSEIVSDSNKVAREEFEKCSQEYSKQLINASWPNVKATKSCNWQQ